ncbi:hypothetical protein FPV67DRAFT_564576 [Lyophyllum atratum]|nr:hypothetical protein FPV67DRAFT_564576 [Lyophyllum atratum]
MPPVRNLKTRRSSGRICNKVPIAYDEQGWETLPAMIDYTRNDRSSPHSTATSPSANSADSEFENQSVRKTKGKSKAANSSNADHVPRPKNAFILYRSHFYQTLGGDDQNQISVAAGKAWKALCDEEKLPFQLMAEKEKRDHRVRFPHYYTISSPPSTATSPSRTSAVSDLESDPVRKSKGKSKAANPSNADYVPRPKNAFILYRSHFYQTLGGDDQNQISVAAGKAWNALCDEEKLPFQLMAEKEKRDHQLEFPHYTYTPGRKGPSAKRKTAGKNKSQPSAKNTLVPKPGHVSHRASRILTSPLTRNFSPPAEIVLPAPPQVPPILSEASEPTFHIKREESPADSESLFGSSFVPTSEIPPLELSPVKTEKDPHADLSSVRPSSYDIIDDQFQPHTAGTGEAQVEAYYNYVDLPNYGASALHTPRTASPSSLDWAMDTAGSSQDVKFEPSYFDYPLNDTPPVSSYDSFNPAPLHVSALYEEKSHMLPRISSLGTPSDHDLEVARRSSVTVPANTAPPPISDSVTSTPIVQFTVTTTDEISGNQTSPAEGFLPTPSSGAASGCAAHSKAVLWIAFVLNAVAGAVLGLL